MLKFTPMNSEQEMADAVSQLLTPSRFGYRLTFFSPAKMKKGRGDDKNPFLDRVFEILTVYNPRLGCDWQAILDSLTEKYNPSWFSQPHPSYDSQHSSPFDYYNRYFWTLKSDPNKFYIHYNLYENSLVLREYHILPLGGDTPRKPTPDEMHEISRWLTHSSPHTDRRQDARGIPPEHQLQFRNKPLSELTDIHLGKDLVCSTDFDHLGLPDPKAV